MESSPSAWTDAELDECVITLCDEFPHTQMAACSRALEYCRRMTPPGTPAALRTAMRGVLQAQTATKAAREAAPRMPALPIPA